MAKKKKKSKKKSKKDSESMSLLESLHAKTKALVVSIICLVLAVVFLLAAFNMAGVAGENIYSLFSMLFGIGYYLLPLMCLGVAVLFVRPGSPDLTVPRLISGAILFITSLALVSFYSPDMAGVVGSYVALPFLWMFDVYASFVILGAVAVISLLVLIESYVSWEMLFSTSVTDLIKGRTTQEDTDEDSADSVADQTAATKNETDTADNEAAETPAEEGGQAPAKKDKELSISNYTDREESDAMMEITSGGGQSGEYSPPPLSLLDKVKGKPGVGDIKANANLIKRTLENFNIDVEMDEISIGPTVTRYALKPAEGVRLSKIVGLQNNLELALAAHPVRIEAPIPGKSLVGIEVPNNTKTTVGLSSLIGSKEYQQSEDPLLVCLGQSISGRSHFDNLAKMPHLLIAGATGSGKSVTIHTLVNSLIFRNSPEQLKFIMVDPKRVELTLYNGIPHLLTPVITNAKKAILAFKWAAKEMDRRYDILEQEKVRDIRSYHENVLPKKEKEAAKKGEPGNVEKMPYIVVVIDEMADLMQAYPNELESVIVRLAQMSRAVGIHLVLSTQRPSVNVITGLIKANVPARIALQVSSQVDSRTILDSVGAEKLLGAGDMLYQSGEMNKPRRIQSAFIKEDEVKDIVEYLQNAYEDQLNDTVDIEKSDQDTAKTIFDIAKEEEEKEERDDLYEEARDLVIEADRASTSYLQRKLRIGYSRAARIMDTLEENGIISEKDGTKARDVLVTEEELESAKAEHDDALGEVGSVTEESEDGEANDEYVDDEAHA